MPQGHYYVSIWCMREMIELCALTFRLYVRLKVHRQTICWPTRTTLSNFTCSLRAFLSPHIILLWLAPCDPQGCLLQLFVAGAKIIEVIPPTSRLWVVPLLWSCEICIIWRMRNPRMCNCWFSAWFNKIRLGSMEFNSFKPMDCVVIVVNVIVWTPERLVPH